MSVVKNERYDTSFIELISDKVMPHTDGLNVIELPKGMQLKWRHRTCNVICGGCGSGTTSCVFQADAIVCGEQLPYIMNIPSEWIVETTTQRFPPVRQTWKDEVNGTNINILVPSHLRTPINPEW